MINSFFPEEQKKINNSEMLEVEDQEDEEYIYEYTYEYTYKYNYTYNYNQKPKEIKNFKSLEDESEKLEDKEKDKYLDIEDKTSKEEVKKQLTELLSRLASNDESE